MEIINTYQRTIFSRISLLPFTCTIQFTICQFAKRWWLCCTQTGSWGQRGMETQRKDVDNLLYSRRLLARILIC